VKLFRILSLTLLLGVNLVNAAGVIELPEAETATIRRGIDLLYDLDYQGAMTNFSSLLPKWKDHPAPWFFSAMVWWIKCSQYDDVERAGALFTRAINYSISKSRALLDKDQTNPAGIFYLAGSLGFSGRFHLMQGNLVPAVTTGWEAYRLLQNNTNAFKHNRDILLGTGLFNFYAGRIPKEARAIARMLGIQGNQDLGLQQLDEVARLGVFAKTEAAMALAHLYTYDLRNGHQGLRYTRELMQRYPHNPEFRLQYAENLLGTGQFDKASESVMTGLKLTDKNLYRPTHRFRFLCLMGKILHTRGRYHETLDWLNKAIALSEDATRGNYLAWAHLRRGDALVNLGNPVFGLRDYQKALELDETGSAGTHSRKRIEALKSKSSAR
jgi:tetratricopeptide (TPR) repeat protein